MTMSFSVFRNHFKNKPIKPFEGLYSLLWFRLFLVHLAIFIFHHVHFCMNTFLNIPREFFLSSLAISCDITTDVCVHPCILCTQQKEYESLLLHNSNRKRMSFSPVKCYSENFCCCWKTSLMSLMTFISQFPNISIYINFGVL